MTQLQVITLIMKVGIPLSLASILIWIGVYTRLQAWWHDSIGTTLVAKSLLLAGLLTFGVLSIYFTPSPVELWIERWGYALLTAAIAPVMLWRTLVWITASKPEVHGTPGKPRVCKKV